MIGLHFLAALAAPQVAMNVPSAGPVVDCRTGPAKRQFGGTEWNVFACSNGTLSVLAAKGNPAFPAKRQFGGTEWNVFACSNGTLSVLAAKGNPAFPAMLSVSIRGGRATVTGPAYLLKQARATTAKLETLGREGVAQLHAEATAASTKR